MQLSYKGNATGCKVLAICVVCVYVCLAFSGHSLRISMHATLPSSPSQHWATKKRGEFCSERAVVPFILLKYWCCMLMKFSKCIVPRLSLHGMCVSNNTFTLWHHFDIAPSQMKCLALIPFSLD